MQSIAVRDLMYARSAIRHDLNKTMLFPDRRNMPAAQGRPVRGRPFSSSEEF